ncbi:hypothetical protein [Vibrio coralliilyticus]|uniref:Uncharacterized protein n=1 Tax=Vibrio coralliilyticus TaxID=190893 RepID=A0AAP6ZNH7_9VIBR|nr:hypothetical protein [Vibrio coralliilyticus]NOI31851.1 hypothetical protein [Vibrio coralliilyticus]NOJ25295.1 hypothetical protein [Vibrio coralliilyticus]
MQVVIIEDQDIIAHAIRDDFEQASQQTLSITVLRTIEEIKTFDFSTTKYIISDLFLGSSIYETLVALYAIRHLNPETSISIFTQSTEVNMLQPILAVIKADHLFDKRFQTKIADIVLNEPSQVFSASKKEMKKAEELLGLDDNTQSILSALADHISVTTIALDKNRSKSAISQVLRKAENKVGAKQYIMKLFTRS